MRTQNSDERKCTRKGLGGQNRGPLFMSWSVILAMMPWCLFSFHYRVLLMKLVHFVTQTGYCVCSPSRLWDSLKHVLCVCNTLLTTQQLLMQSPVHRSSLTVTDSIIQYLLREIKQSLEPSMAVLELHKWRPVTKQLQYPGRHPEKQCFVNLDTRNAFQQQLYIMVLQGK